jgi:hypothetical protein
MIDNGPVRRSAPRSCNPSTGPRMPAIVPNLERQAIALAIRQRWNLASWLRMFQSDTPITRDTLLSELAEATWSGYAAVNLAGQWSAPYQQDPGRWQWAAPRVVYQHSGGLVDNTCYGLYVDDGARLLWAVRFAVPVTFASGSPPLPTRVRADLGELVLVE